MAHRGQIFTPHFTTKPQAAPSGELLNELPNGLPNGLGLSNAVELAQAMGGTLVLQEANIEGSAFVLNLPHILSIS